jgi:hypothetical protein
MATAEHREPCDSRGSCTVLGAPGGEIPPGDSSSRHTNAAMGGQGHLAEAGRWLAVLTAPGRSCPKGGVAGISVGPSRRQMTMSSKTDEKNQACPRFDIDAPKALPDRPKCFLGFPDQESLCPGPRSRFFQQIQTKPSGCRAGRF